jgi:DivIVA domain-containing protein
MKDKEGSAATPRKALTPLEVQQKEFGVARMGGYKMREVDEFLDTVTDTLSALSAEVERLRARSDSAPVVGMPDLDDVSRQADEIIRRAREEAAGILAAAKGQAAMATGSGTPEPMSSRNRASLNAFLANERGFLQNLAGLVQGHAEAVKGIAKASRVGATAQDATPSEPHDEVSVPEAEVPDVAPRPDEPATPTSSEPASPDSTVLLPRAERPVRIEEPEPASVGGADNEADARGAGDRSLKELFWGEE